MLTAWATTAKSGVAGRSIGIVVPSTTTFWFTAAPVVLTSRPRVALTEAPPVLPATSPSSTPA